MRLFLNGCFFKFYEWWGYQSVGSDWPLWTITALFTFSYFILNDFSRFFVHKLLHEVPFLWEFHKVHHSARVLTPITVFRTHPVEGILFSFRSIFVQGFLIAVFTFLFGDRVDPIYVLRCCCIYLSIQCTWI